MKLKRYIKLDFTPLVDITMILVLAYMVILYHQKPRILSMLLPVHHTCGLPPPIHNTRKYALALYFSQDEEQMLSQAEKTFSKPLIVSNNVQ